MTCSAQTISEKLMSIYVMSRLENITPPHTALLQADISSITWKSVNKAAPTVNVASGSLTVSDVILDTVLTQSDNPDWTHGIGYNFATVIPGSAFPSGNKTYVVVITVTPVSGDPIIITREHKTSPTYGT